MPELTVTHIVLLAVLAIAGAGAGWFARNRRAVEEKEAVKAMWKKEIDRQRSEHNRVAEQNKGLMELVSQQQAHQTKLKKQVGHLSEALGDANDRLESLQREVNSRNARNLKLKRELKKFHERLPPLTERYRIRTEEAANLEAALEESLMTIRDLKIQNEEAANAPMPIEPLRNGGPLTDGLEASNDEEDEYVDEIGDESTPVLIDEATMIEGEPVPDEDEAVGEDVREADDPSADEAYPDDLSPDDAPPDVTPLNEHSLDVPSHVVHARENNSPGEPPQERDNLKKIRGVGPAIEKTLNEMGIFSFRQVAEMNDYDIDRIARRLKGFHSRIQREDWVGQAQTLLDRAASA